MFDVLTRIEELREVRGWSVYRLAKESGIPQSTIATWYQKNLYPPVDKIETLCQVFHISLAEFFTVPEDGADSHHALTAQEQLLLQGWTNLSDQQKQAVLSLITILSQQL